MLYTVNLGLCDYVLFSQIYFKLFLVHTVVVVAWA